MSNKQLFNKKNRSRFVNILWAASILVGSLLFLGGGHASAAETIEATTRETTSIEHIQSKQESTSTQEGSNTKEISTTQEPSTTESTSNTQETPLTQEVKSTEETPSSQETASTEETPSSEENQSNTITTREEPSTEQASSTKDIHTKETSTTETSKAPATQQSIKFNLKRHNNKHLQQTLKHNHLRHQNQQALKETIPSSNKETSTQEQLSTQESKPTSHKSVVQDAKEDNVTPVHENISTYSNQISAQLALKADTTSTVASTSESKVNIQDVPKTEFKNLTSNEKKYCIKRYNKMRIHKINNRKLFFQQHQCGRLRNVQKCISYGTRSIECDTYRALYKWCGFR